MLIPDFFGIFYGENEALIIIEYQVNQFRSAPKHGEAKMLRKAAFFIVAQVGKVQDHTTWIWQKPSAEIIAQKWVLPWSSKGPTRFCPYLEWHLTLSMSAPDSFLVNTGIPPQE